MTNEQAIRILEEFKVIDDWTIVHLPPMEDAVDKAIEALRDVINCVKCEHYTERETATGINGECKMDTAHRGDLISRQEAIDALMNDSDWADAIPTIKSLPSAEPKTGKWIKSHVEDLGLITTYICSECRMQSSSTYNFCPNCGARMNGGEEE